MSSILRLATMEGLPECLSLYIKRMEDGAYLSLMFTIEQIILLMRANSIILPEIYNFLDASL